MEILFLGTGTSGGVPVIGCRCRVCRSDHRKDKRLRSSVYFKKDTTALVIDTGPDFRSQMLSNRIERLDAALVTHTHKDHIAGLDDAKPFAVINQKPFPIYADVHSIDTIKAEFAYAFGSFRYPGIPDFELHTVGDAPFSIGKLSVTPIPVMHHRLPILGYRIGDTAYITDANAIPDSSLKLLTGLETLIINALRITPHIAHFSLSEALTMIDIIRPRRAYITHVSHQLGLHREVAKNLPKDVYLAYDGLRL